MAEQNLGSAGNITETYSAGVVTVQANISFPANKYGLAATIPANISLNLITALNQIAADTGNATVEEVEAFVAKLLPLS